MSERSSDFEDGAYDSDNVRPAASGLTLQKPGQGYAIVEVRSPYVIVPTVGRMETIDDDRDASRVEIDADGAALAISLDNGLTWSDLPRPVVGPQTIDLTRHVCGSYGYLLKITLRGEPGQAVVRSLCITTWVQVAPASLPALRRGTNRMEYRVGDHFGLPTRVLELQTNGSDRGDFLKYLHHAPPDFDPQRGAAGRARGLFVVKVAAAPHSHIAWLSVGGNFVTHQQGNTQATRNAIAYALDEAKDFVPLYRADVPADQNHWHYNVDREVRLDRPAKDVYLRYEGDPGVNNLRIYAHCLDERPPRRGPVSITHAWTESGTSKTQTVTLDKPGSYEVIAAAEPSNDSVQMAVPSGRAR